MQFLLRTLTCAGFAFVSFAALAQNKPAAPTPQAKQELKMDTLQLITLIKSTIMALQHANQTGNYSVLRDLGSPIFRENFDQSRLTAVFQSLRSRGVNLSVVMFLAPNLIKQPEMTPGNELHLTGNFPTQPLQIQYEMLFLQLDGVWRLNGLSVDAVPVQAVADASAQPQAAAPALLAPAPPVKQTAKPEKPEKKKPQQKPAPQTDK